MRRQNILRMLLFVVFFSIGAAVLSGSILCDDLVRYYTNKRLLEAAEESLNRLKTLNTDYDALLQQLQKDPNLVRRIAPATLGTEPDAKDTIYPKAAVEQLAAARKALTEDLNPAPRPAPRSGWPRRGGVNQQSTEPVVPNWVTRCSEPARRVILFLAGAFLILISFIWFGSTEQKRQEE